ncbi:Pvc16 family protein [Streptomyces diastatochromogenes]|uniref:Pvc16 family protein n=1 Tax=Streptomyces diastatochromogenes TaxID=42236 RepID=UPI002F26AA21
MSNALALATVTQALALLIEHNLHPEIDLAVSVETRKPPADPPTDPTITVFLYQVSHNPSMRNSDLVTRASDGTLLKRPAAAIDLHFLISAYGEEQELVGQRLIGSVVRTLHEIPVLPRELIEEAAERPYLAGSDLAESLQKVRFTPTQMDVDETSKLWGMLNNTPYSLSVAYQASLVLLDGHQKPTPARPVKRPEVTVVPEVPPEAPLGDPTVPLGDAAPVPGAADGPAADGRSADDVPTGAPEAPAPPKRPAKKTTGGPRKAAKSVVQSGSSGRGRAETGSRPRPRKTPGDGPRQATRADDAGRSDDGGED